MKKWLVLWIISIPIFLFSFLNSFFITSKITGLSQEECKQMFIFTPQDVGFCSEIYPIDIFLISLKTQPFSYVCLISGMYLIGFIVYSIYRFIKKPKLKTI